MIVLVAIAGSFTVGVLTGLFIPLDALAQDTQNSFASQSDLEILLQRIIQLENIVVQIHAPPQADLP